jgi:peptidoglycan-associated lipoprotein
MRLSAVVVVLLTAAIVSCKSTPEAPPEPPRPPAPATPPPAPPPTAPRDIAPTVNEYDKLKQTSTDEIDRMGLFADVRFDYDRSDIREGDAQTLRKNADVLKKFDFLKITIEGHCDERGTVEYNLALGERRARAAYDYLISLGVPAERMKTVSYGKEVPLCQEHGEDCWARNRRAKFAVTGKTSGR